jgi:hypothetical protein
VKRKKKIVAAPRMLLLICIVPLIFGLVGLAANGSGQLNPQQVYQEHEPIIIQHEDDFPLLGFEGSGTIEDPYMIENLTITSAGYAIHVQFGVEAVFIIRNCRILGSEGNTAELIRLGKADYCKLEGLYIEGGGIGIDIWDGYMTAIASCIVLDCETAYRFHSGREITFSSCIAAGGSNGISCNNVVNSSFTDNKIYSNTFWGLQFNEWASNNSVVHNSFGWNGGTIAPLEIRHIIDDGQNNTFDDGESIGNAYSDYDGIGPMELHGDAESIDNFPRVLSDTEPPTINEPIDLVVAGDSRTVSLEVEDLFPLNYASYLDGVTTERGYWQSGVIEITITDIEDGQHNLTIQFLDGAGNSDSIELEIQQQTLPPLNIGIVLGVAAILGGLVTIEVYRRKRITTKA